MFGNPYINIDLHLVVRDLRSGNDPVIVPGPAIVYSNLELAKDLTFAWLGSSGELYYRGRHVGFLDFGKSATVAERWQVQMVISLQEAKEIKDRWLTQAAC